MPTRTFRARRCPPTFPRPRVYPHAESEQGRRTKTRTRQYRQRSPKLSSPRLPAWYQSQTSRSPREAEDKREQPSKDSIGRRGSARSRQARHIKNCTIRAALTVSQPRRRMALQDRKVPSSSHTQSSMKPIKAIENAALDASHAITRSFMTALDLASVSPYVAASASLHISRLDHPLPFATARSPRWAT
jgi:hypothetical protein